MGPGVLVLFLVVFFSPPTYIKLLHTEYLRYNNLKIILKFDPLAHTSVVVRYSHTSHKNICSINLKICQCSFCHLSMSFHRPVLSLWLSRCDVSSAVQRIVGQNTQKSMLVSQQDCSQRALHKAPPQGHQEPFALLHRSAANPYGPARYTVVPHKYEYYLTNKLQKQIEHHH